MNLHLLHCHYHVLCHPNPLLGSPPVGPGLLSYGVTPCGREPGPWVGEPVPGAAGKEGGREVFRVLWVSPFYFPRHH